MSFFGSFKVSESDVFASDLDLRAPSFAVVAPRHSEETGRAQSAKTPLVLGIDAMIDIAKIAEPIVRSLSIEMVNDVRPFFMHMKPRQAVGHEVGLLKTDHDVAINRSQAPGDVADSTLTAILTPMEQTSRRVVVKSFAQTRNCKISNSHIGLRNRLIGQTPASVSRTAPASLF